MRAFAAVLLVFVAWNADVEAFPVAGESVALGELHAAAAAAPFGSEMAWRTGNPS